MTTGANGALAILTFATGTIAARLLGPVGRGELAAIQTWPMFISTVAMLGMGEAAIYFGARDPSRAGSYLASAISISSIACVPVLIAGFVAMPLLLASQRPEVVTASRWYLATALVYLWIGVPHSALRAVRSYRAWNLLRMVPSIVWLWVLFIGWLIGRSRPTFVADLYVAGLAIVCLPLVFHFVRRDVVGPFRPLVAQWTALLRFGVPSIAGGLPQMLNLKFDQMLMAGLLSAQSLGLYAVAVAWSSALPMLLQSFATILFPELASRADHDDQVHVFTTTLRVVALLSVVFAPAYSIATPFVLPIVFGEAFTASVKPAMVLIAAGAVLGIGQLLEAGLRGLGHPMDVAISELCGLLVTLVTLVFLLRRMGIVGAAIASLLGYSGVMVSLMVMMRRRTGQSIRTIVIPKISEFRRTFAIRQWRTRLES
jgi:O-antigen/teichoic acid export membrane protein